MRVACRLRRAWPRDRRRPRPWPGMLRGRSQRGVPAAERWSAGRELERPLHVEQVVERLVADASRVEPPGEAGAREAPLRGERDAPVGDAVADVGERAEPSDRAALAAVPAHGAA